MITDLFKKIAAKTASHDDFATDCKNSPEMIQSIQEFGKELFFYKDGDTVASVYENLNRVSTELNVQFTLYSADGVYDCKKNRFIDPLVISIYYRSAGDQYVFFTLYHENYKIIDPDNFNASTEFFPEEQPVSKIYYLEELISELLGEIAEVQLEDAEKQKIKEAISQIVPLSGRGQEFEEKLNRAIYN